MTATAMKRWKCDLCGLEYRSESSALWCAALDAAAAIADTHPKDGDVKQAPLVSGGGAGTAIAQPPGDIS